MRIKVGRGAEVYRTNPDGLPMFWARFSRSYEAHKYAREASFRYGHHYKFTVACKDTGNLKRYHGGQECNHVQARTPDEKGKVTG